MSMVASVESDIFLPGVFALSKYDSLHNIPLDQLSEMVDGRAHLTALVAKRLRAIHEGAQPLVEPKPDEALLALVCREVLEGKIRLEKAEIAEPAAVEDLDFLGLSEEGGAATEL